jgi:hypothetical protein
MFIDIVDSKPNNSVPTGGLVRWNFDDHDGDFPTDPDVFYIAKDDTVYPAGTQFYSVNDTLPDPPTIADFYTK